MLGLLTRVCGAKNVEGLYGGPVRSMTVLWWIERLDAHFWKCPLAGVSLEKQNNPSSVFLVLEPSKNRFLTENTIPKRPCQGEDIILL